MPNYESDSDTEYIDEYYDSIIYNGEEKSTTKYNIILCELYNKNIHGYEKTQVLYHYLVFIRYKELCMEYINEDIESLYENYNSILDNTHDIFKNYRNIILNKNNIKPEIAECIYLKSGHCIAILKTFWIKIIQRTWKNIFNKKKDIIKKRSSLYSLKYREVNGNWPKDCLYYPSLKGMLSCLHN
jgi:hypothetical protein